MEEDSVSTVTQGPVQGEFSILVSFCYYCYYYEVLTRWALPPSPSDAILRNFSVRSLQVLRLWCFQHSLWVRLL